MFIKIHRCVSGLTFLTLVSLILLSTSCSAQKATKNYLLALSKADHHLAMVDPVTLKVLATMPVGEDPHEVIASPDGKTAYVTIYGGGRFHEIDVLNLKERTPKESIDTRPLFGPHDIVYTNNKVWFSAEGSKAVGRFDPSTNKLDWSMGTGEDRTHMLFVTDGGERIYTTNISSGTVSILVDSLMQPGRNAPPNAPARREWEQTIVKVSPGCEGMDVTPDGKYLWTASAEDGNVFIVDLGNKKLAGQFAGHVEGANRLKFTPDGKLAFVTSLRSGELTIFDVASKKELQRLKLGRGCAGILMSPIEPKAYIACSADNYIAVIDLKSLKMIGKFEVGGTPDGMCWASQE